MMRLIFETIGYIALLLLAWMFALIIADVLHN